MWFFLALLAGFLFAVNRLISRAVFTKGVNPIAFLAIHEFVAGVLLLPIAMANFSLPQSFKTWAALVLCAVFILLADLFGSLSLKNIEHHCIK
jgi:drug/metabolite transporter (DMT)-like permease